MRTANTQHPGKPVHQRIIYRTELPVGINWAHGKINHPPLFAYHPELEFQFIKRGKGSYFIGNRKYRLQKNMLLVVLPNEIHFFIPNPAEPYLEKAALMFKTSLLKNDRWLPRFPRTFPRMLRLSEMEATKAEIILNEIIDEENKKEKYWQETVSLKLKEFLLLVKRAGLQNPPIQQPNPKISRILTYIEERFTRNLTCGLIADEFALSPAYLSWLFKKHAGMNLKHYIIQRRIVEAKRLLIEHPDFKISLIHQEIGFNDFSLFNRNFKALTGLTPSAYRKFSHQDSK